MQNKAAIVEYWRKKYLNQAIIVAVTAFGVAGGLAYAASYWGFKLLFFMIAFLICYLMIKELKADLQARAEQVILFSESKNHSVQFDFGKGIAEKELTEQNVIEEYHVRECRNVIKGEKYLLEEDGFYAVWKAKFFSVYQSVFEGIILSFAVKNVSNKKSGLILRQDSHVTVSGEVADIIKEDSRKTIFSLASLLKADKIKVVILHGRIYFWIKTSQPLFYQFSLIRINSVNTFIKRIQKIQEAAEAIVKAME